VHEEGFPSLRAVSFLPIPEGNGSPERTMMGKKYAADHGRKVAETKKKKQVEFIATCPNLCTVDDAVRILGISRRTVHRRIDVGNLHPIQRTPYILLERAELEHTDSTEMYRVRGNTKVTETKRQKRMTQTLPYVIIEIRQLIEKGIKPTQVNCRDIKGYGALLRYYTQSDLVRMALDLDISKKEVS